MQTDGYPKGKAGFTLIELLVVVAIIALLVSILVPSLQQAREQAIIAVCATNLHSVHVVLGMYDTDYHSLIEHDTWPAPWDGDATSRLALLRHYAGGDGNAKVFDCPNVSPVFPKEVATYPSNYGGAARLFWGYGYLGRSKGQGQDNLDYVTPYPLPNSLVTAPPDMPLIGDVAYQDVYGGWDQNGIDVPPDIFVGGGHFRQGGKGTSYGLRWHFPNTPFPLSGLLAGGNFAYTGGHVIWANVDDMEIPENQQDWSRAMRWPLPK